MLPTECPLIAGWPQIEKTPCSYFFRSANIPLGKKHIFLKVNSYIKPIQLNSMKRLLLLLLFVILALPGIAQKPLYFKTISYLDYSRIEGNKKIIGGFSAIEYNPGNKVWTIVSDRDADKKYSYIFHPDLTGDSLRNDWTSSTKLNQANVESYRVNKGSFIGEIIKDSIIVKLHPSKQVAQSATKNRGIESLTFMPGSNDLWYAYESGNTVDCQKHPFTRFYKVIFDTTKQEYDFEHEKPYEYAINRCDCLDKGQAFDGDYGNGVSEILAYDENHFLILERCFNEKNSVVRIILGEISEKNKKIIPKDTLFDFKDAPSDVKPGNLEGMTWGPKEAGDSLRTIYLISDDNNKEKQKTRLIVLSEKMPDGNSSISVLSHEDSLKLADCDKLLQNIPKSNISYNSDTLTKKIYFAPDGSIISAIPSVLKTNDSIQIKINVHKIDTLRSELNKRFISSIKFLREQKSESPILKLIKFTNATAADSIKCQREQFYDPYIYNNVPFALTLNAKPVQLFLATKDTLWSANVKITKAVDDRKRQNLVLTKVNLENKFLKEVFDKTKNNYNSWAKDKEYFDTLYAEYRSYSIEIDRLLLKDSLLTKAAKSCNCSKHDEGSENIKKNLCILLKKISLSQTQLCAMATQIAENNRCWMRSWLWYTGGKPKLNPFGKVSVSEFNSQVNKRLAIAEAQLQMYNEFSKHNQVDSITYVEKFLKPHITQLAANIASLKALKDNGNVSIGETEKWLTNTTKTGQILNKVLLYSTNNSTIHWMNHYNAKDEFIKMNKKDALPERVYEKDVVHGVVHNLLAKQKISSKETVTKTELRTEFDIALEPFAEATAKAVAAFETSNKKRLEMVMPVEDSAATVIANCRSEEALYKSSKTLIEWLSEQTEPPLAEMEEAYETFDIVDAGAVYHSQEALISESRSALGTNIITYDIFEEGKDKPVVKDKYQTYENVRFWPFISVNYVFGSRASTIFDNTTNTFKAYTEMDNFEVFAGAKWYLGPSNVTRTPKRSKFIEETVGKSYQNVRGNGFRGKTFLFLGLGIRHKFLKNYGIGAGRDIVPGLSLNAGVNMYFDKKYELVNGIVRKDFDIARFRAFIGLAIDVNVVTRFISLF
jgi:hypothetical protein